MDFASLYHLQTTFSRLDTLLQAALARMQEAGGDPSDMMRGLVITADEVERSLTQLPLSGLWDDNTEMNLSLVLPPDTPPDLPFLNLVEQFSLTPTDAYILLLCLAPEIDRRYERVYGFLQDDVTLKRASVHLLMNLLGNNAEQRFSVWERLQPHKPLMAHRLIVPLANSGISQTFTIAQRVVSYLLGSDMPEPLLGESLLAAPKDLTPTLPPKTFDALCTGLANAPIVYMKGKAGLGQHSTALALCVPYHLPLVAFDSARLKALEPDAWRLALREATLRGAAILLVGWEQLLHEETTQPDRAFWDALHHYPRPVFLCGELDWEPLDPHRARPMLRVSFDVPEVPERRDLWESELVLAGAELPTALIDEVANKFRFSRQQIQRAVRTAVDVALTRGEPLNTADVYSGIGAHISLQLGHLAERIVPRFTWDDLILPPDTLMQLYELTARAKHLYRVQHEWGFQQRISNAAGVSALFAGDSGTGKTLSVQVIAHELGLALYRIDLSAVVSKYIGETEKNLRKIFEEARASNAILFFDEADAIFGKRSEVKDARDRYANIEIAYLLQQIEDYDGVAVLASNFRQNLDDAFTRRLDFMVDFPFPDAEYRERIWAAHFPPKAPLGDDVNLGDVARRYHLAGGNIRNAALASAFLAAAEGDTITMRHIQHAIRREHQKMGRLMEEF